ncbi:uncharacterized protein RAG0_09064 [Rhynchosporium agropyri]|uniref:Uncharacterized protein n=1 Tax=Rhynchosporium agropyri TaxID=914238 RepID=A0A1E1KTP8_9HELO|nr:uncharacterized protein RAG0_09064 [Rhynchosporium agropyri]
MPVSRQKIYLMDLTCAPVTNVSEARETSFDGIERRNADNTDDEKQKHLQ